MKRKHLEAARWQARARALGQFDWTTLADFAATPHVNRPVRAAELRDVQKLNPLQQEILRLHRRGLQPRDLATLFAMDDAAVQALLFGKAGSA